MCEEARTEHTRFLLLYASQTGQAEAIARRLNNAALEQGFLPDLHCVSTFGCEFDLSKENCFVLITSTTDEGLVPEKARRFLRYLRKAPDRLLNGVKYAALGLGDTNYNNFCNACRTFDSHFEALGAVRFYETGYADDAVGLEIVVEPWVAGLWSALRSCLPAKMTAEAQSQQCLPAQNDGEKCLTVCNLATSVELTLPLLKDPLVSVQLGVSDVEPTSQTNVWQGGQPLPFQESKIVPVTLTSAERLTSSDAVKEAWELEFQLPASANVDVCFKPGDSFGFLCVNRPSEVAYVIERLEVPGDCVVAVSHSKNARNMEHLPKAPLTVQKLLTTCCDVRGIPKKIFLRTLAEYTADATEKRRLLELSSREGSKDYITFILEARTSFLDVLKAFPTCKPHLVVLLEHLPRLLPRYYSVCNWSPQEQAAPRRFKILYKRCPIPGSDEEGLCTGWLTNIAQTWSPDPDLTLRMKSLSLGETGCHSVWVYLRKNATFRFPESLDKPVIMIGPGSGVAPFLSYLQWRRDAMAQSPRTVPAEAWLFTGCRHRRLDFLYEDELKSLLSGGVLSKLVVSFSRDAVGGEATQKSKETSDEPDERPKGCEGVLNSDANAQRVAKEESWECHGVIQGGKHVQDSIRLLRGDIAHLISLDDSRVYVCGDAVSMATSVRNTIVDVLVDEHIVASKQDGIAFVKELQKDGRYLEDIWTA